MAQLFIFDSDEKLVQVLNNEGLNNNFYGAIHLEQINGENRFEFKISANQEASNDVIEGGFVGFEDLDGDFQLFEIKRIVEIRSDVLIKQVFSEHVIYELLDELIVFKQHFGETPEDILRDILTTEFEQGAGVTRWNVGVVEPTSVINRTRFRLVNKYSSIRRLTVSLDAELKFRIIFNGSSIESRFVDLLDRRGEDTGKRFVYGKDLTEVRREIDVNEIKTAMYGFGKAQEIAGGGKRLLRFRDIDFDGTIDGDEVVKPEGQIFVEDTEAKEKWGRRSKNLVSQNQSSAETDLTGFEANNVSLSRVDSGIVNPAFGNWSILAETGVSPSIDDSVIIQREFMRNVTVGGVDVTVSSFLQGTTEGPTVPLKFRIFEYDENDSLITSQDSPSFVPSVNRFQRFDFSFFTNIDTVKVEFSIAITEANSKAWFLDGVQLEEEGFSTPWTLGGIFNRFGTFTDSEEINAQELLENTWRNLQENNSPLVSFDMSVLDLEAIAGVSHEKIRLGDDVKVIDTEFNPELRLDARIVELKRNLEEPEKNKIILSNLLPRITDDGEVIRRNEVQIDTNLGIWEGSQFVPNMITDHSFEIVQTTGAVLNSDQEFSVDLTHPDIGNSFWWNWNGTDPRIVSFLNTDVTGVLFDLQGAVISDESRPFIHHSRHFTIPNFGLDGAYTVSCFVTAYGQTTVDGTVILKYSAIDDLGAELKTSEVREKIRASQQLNFKRIETTIRDLPNDTDLLKVEILIDETDDPNLKVLADGVQAVPIENSLPYNPESNLWKHLRSLAGVKPKDFNIVDEMRILQTNSNEFSTFTMGGDLVINGSQGVDIHVNNGSVVFVTRPDNSLAIIPSTDVGQRHEFDTSQSSEQTMHPNIDLEGFVGSSSNRYNAMYAGAFNTTSDSNVKQDIQDVDIQECYDRLKKLNLKKYRFIKEVNKNHNARYYTGILADREPDIEFTDEGKKSINLYQMTSYLVGANQKLIEKVESLEKKLSDFKGGN